MTACWYQMAAGAVAVTGMLLAAPAQPQTRTICATAAPGCDFSGEDALQRAVDAAEDGARLLLRAGRHRGDGYRDVPLDDLLVRGRTVVTGKSLTIIGEPAAVLDLGSGTPASAIVVHRGALSLQGVTIEDARAALPDDDIYDGHGLFLVDATAILEDVTFRRVGKMALSVRGASAASATAVRLLDGHVGVWIEEAARLELVGCVIAGNDSAAVAAYADARVTVSGCVFEKNEDDALYAAERAVIEAADSLFLHNRPFALRAVDDAAIIESGGVFYGNAAIRNPEPAAVTVRASRSFPAYCSAQEERQSESTARSCSQ